MKKREPPAEEGAPAYMAQFTSLMTILLAFFIVMLTMGQEKASRYNMEGFGLIRDSAFGLRGGGLGVLNYMRAVLQGNPDIDAARRGAETPEDSHLGHVRGDFDRDQMDAEGIVHTEIQDWGHSVRVATPIAFADGGWMLSSEGRQFLDKIGDVLYNLEGYQVTVACYEAAGADPRAARMAASRRALAVVNYLERQKRVPRDMLRAVGYSDPRYMAFGDEIPAQKTAFFVRKTPVIDDRRL